MYLVWRQSGGLIDGVAAGELDMRQMHIPIVLLLVDDDSKHLSHGMVYTFRTSISLRVVCACGDFL